MEGNDSDQTECDETTPVLPADNSVVKMKPEAKGDLSLKNVYMLTLMTLSYIVGELTHYLINTTNRELAREVGYGEKACYLNSSATFNTSKPMVQCGEGTDSKDDIFQCSDAKDEIDCDLHGHCYWEYSGLGSQYQVLAGPAFINVFIISAVLLAVLSDWLYDKLSRTVMLSVGTATFSISCLLMGLSTQYWQLVILRMFIALGLSVMRPVSGALIAELFSSSARGVANGIFSWGVYYGYGLAYLFSNLSSMNILGYGWRAPYVLAALPGVLMAFLMGTTVKDPRVYQSVGSLSPKNGPKKSNDGYLKRVIKSFSSPEMILLILAAFFRHTAGYCWAYNTKNFFNTYYPCFDIGLWTFSASVFGGSFGVFAGGFFSDRLVKYFGLHSRLWLLSVCTIIASPFAVATLYFPPPWAFVCLILYYFFAETWFSVLFTVIVEIVDPEVRSTCIAIFLFLMNLVGGNLPVIVAPLRNYFGDYRTALYLVWPTFCATSSVIFFLASIPLWLRGRRTAEQSTAEQSTESK